ncbi:MAG TPA: peptidyl-prolyl cis-trans isomerase, partial [Alphaproteobacteria bacterium]
GRTKISQADFERVATNAVRQRNMSLQEAYRFGMLNNILDDMIDQEILRQWTNARGLTVGRDQVADTVQKAIKEQVQPGETPQAALDRILRTNGMSESELMRSIRQSSANDLVQKPLSGAVSYVPKLATEAFARFHAERRDIEFFTLTAEGVGASIKADDETLAAYYEGIKDQFQIPEERRFRVMVLDLNDIKPAPITEDDVAKAYAERQDQFKIGEQRNIEQAVLADEAAAKTLAESVRAGQSLKTLGGTNYRPASDVTKDGLPSELAEPVFTAEKGTVLNPIKTPLGWHVIRVIDVKPARTQEYASVKADLRKELESDALHDEMEARITKVDEALSNGDAIEQIGESMALPIKTIGPIDAKGNYKADPNADPVLGKLAQNKDLLATLFELMEGETADLAEVSDGIYAIFALDTVTPTRDRDFAEVKSDVEKRWLSEQRQTALNSVVETLMTKLEKGEVDFATVAKEQNAVLKTARNVSRESKVAGLNDPVALNRLFDETDLDNVVRVNSEDGVILAKVLDARIPEAGRGNPTPEAEKQWRQQMQQSVMNLFFSDIRKAYHAKVNDELLQRMYGAEADASQP